MDWTVRNQVILVWVIGYISSIAILQVLLHFSTHPLLISTTLIYLLTFCVFGYRLLNRKLSRESAIIRNQQQHIQRTDQQETFCEEGDIEVKNKAIGVNKEFSNNDKTAETSEYDSETEAESPLSYTGKESYEDKMLHQIEQAKKSSQNQYTIKELIIDEDPSVTNINGSSSPATLQQQPPSHCQRIYSLDYIKIFLTFLVVTHHSICAFGGCSELQGNNDWYLTIGNYPNRFNEISGIIAMFNQAYFVPLFYFISAYVTPNSYEKKGKEIFMYDRAKRIWIPAMLVSFTISPASAIIAQLTSSSKVYYIPAAGPYWFLFWLLIFNWMYSTFRESSLYDNDNTETITDGDDIPFPSIAKCWISGGLLCGIGMLGFCYAVSWFPFYTMPMTFGSFINNIFFFAIGIYASKTKWLGSQLGLVWPLQYLTMFIEAMLLVALGFLLEDIHQLLIVYSIIIGLFSVDMSMVLLHFFSRFANYATDYGAILSQSAYTVYLIHPIFITSLTSIYIKIYNHINGYDVIEFNNSSVNSESELLGKDKGSLHLFAGFMIVLVLTNLICWPLAWILRKQPILKGIL